MTTPFLGEIRLLPYNFAPLGWLDCDGSLLAISQYDALYTLLGTTYGGDGVNTFALPDLRGRVPLHQGTGIGLTTRTMGELAGSESVTLLATQMAAHTHGITVTSGNADAATPAATNELGQLNNDTLYTSDTAGLQSLNVASTMIAPDGGSQPHDNLMPTLTVRYCIAVEGIYPSQS
jgi:microcystin-dependent protein